MSDISTAMAPDVPVTQPEVTIPEQGSTGGVGEVGKQAPDKSPEQIAADNAIARRAAVEKAFEKGKIAAEARAKENPKDLGKTPGEERGKQAKPDQAEQQQRNRGERGRFAPAQPADTAPVEAGQPGDQPKRHAPLPETAPYREAPPRFSDAAKSDWNGAPESVRAATTQAFQQYEKGIQQYRQVAEAFQPIAHYHQMAADEGTNLRTVLDNYRGMEQKLKGDLFGGFDLITHNLGYKHPDGRPVTFYDVASAYLQQSPEQRGMVQQRNNAQAQHMMLQEIKQEQQRLATEYQRMQYQQRYNLTLEQINRFADSHPGFDERSDLIKVELDHGYSIDIAYDRAMKLRPGNGSTHAAQTRNTSAQTRDEVDRSISGAPSNGTTASYRTQKKSGSNREALSNALRRVRTGV